ncbi:MAG: hypothetical protein ACLS43_01345 [Evtepia gabavorous]
MYEIRCIPPACRSSPALLVACGGRPQAPATLGQALLQDFQTRVKDSPQADLETLAQGLLDQEDLEFQGAVTPVEPGLPGLWQRDDPGLFPGVMFAPVISTIPFVGYLFRLEEQTSGQDFVQTLRDAADPRWNICTEADETVVQQEGDIVFFLMCPQSMEE